MKLLTLLTLCSCPLFAGNHSISGQVLNQARNPEAGAVVYLQNEANSQVTVTDPSGNYLFPTVPEGDYTEKASAQDKVSPPTVLHLSAEDLAYQNVTLSTQVAQIPVTLKVSLASGKGEAVAFSFSIDPSCADSDNTLNDASIETALLSLKGGEYEIVLTKPGSAYVGTCLVLNDAGPDMPQGRVIHTSGMEITSEDYDNAVSDMANVPQNATHRL